MTLDEAWKAFESEFPNWRIALYNTAFEGGYYIPLMYQCVVNPPLSIGSGPKFSVYGYTPGEAVTNAIKEARNIMRRFEKDE